MYDYIIDKPPLEDALMHYGVKGMRWRHKKGAKLSLAQKKLAGMSGDAYQKLLKGVKLVGKKGSSASSKATKGSAGGKGSAVKEKKEKETKEIQGKVQMSPKFSNFMESLHLQPKSQLDTARERANELEKKRPKSRVRTITGSGSGLHKGERVGRG